MFVFISLTHFAAAYGLLASQIPRKITLETTDGNGHTRCGDPVEPALQLAECTEPLASNVEDFRGNWAGLQRDGALHWERFEQCGDRLTGTTYTAGGFVVHDFLKMDGTMEHGCVDVQANATPECKLLRASGQFIDGCMILHANQARISRCPSTVNGQQILIWKVMMGPITVQELTLRKVSTSYEQTKLMFQQQMAQANQGAMTAPAPAPEAQAPAPQAQTAEAMAQQMAQAAAQQAQMLQGVLAKVTQIHETISQQAMMLEQQLALLRSQATAMQQQGLASEELTMNIRKAEMMLVELEVSALKSYEVIQNVQAALNSGNAQAMQAVLQNNWILG